MAGPIPTRLISLSDLKNQRKGEKVRFLGCVLRYDARSGYLTIARNQGQGNRDQALVDVNLLLETLKSTDTRVGEWVNVMGYVTSCTENPIMQKASQATMTSVQAIVLWSAGSVKTDEYEEALIEKQHG